LQLTAMSQTNRINGNDVVDFNLVTGGPAFGRFTQFRRVPEPARTEIELYGAQLNYRFKGLDLIGVSSYSAVRPRMIDDATSDLQGLGVFPATPVTPAAQILNQPEYKVTEEVRLVAPRTGSIEWMLGGFLQHESLKSSDTFVATSLIGHNVRAGTLTERAGFADVTVFLPGNVDITGGARISNLSQTSQRSFGGMLYNPTEPDAVNASHQDFSETAQTYLVNTRWRPDTGLTVYGRVASGYRPGGARTVPPDAPAGLRNFYTSDALWSYETGLRLQGFEKRLNLDLATFWINWTHIQALQPVGPFLIDGNAGTARSQGLELQGRYSAEGLNLGIDGAYTHARYTESEPAVGIVAGDPLHFVPRWSTTVFSSYSRAIGAGWHLEIAGDIQYQSTRLDDVGTHLPGYVVCNGRVAFNREWLGVTLYVKNATDREALLGFGGPPTPSQYGRVVNARRTVGILLSETLW